MRCCRWFVCAVVVAATIGGCKDGRAANRAPAAHTEYSIEAELAAFRALDSSPVPPYLDGPTSIDSLVSQFARSLSRRDTAGLRHLQITRSEFAYLYYPETRLSRPPYELDPATMWTQISSQREAGARRLVAKYGETDFRIRKLVCQPPDEQNLIVIHQCSVATNRDSSPRQLFGSIVERNGRFKFVGLANRL
jgi:hypothetical protein